LEALSDSLQKLSRDEAKVTILHKGVGPISESDVMLAAASSAVVVGFHVSPTSQARKSAENEGVDIRLYTIIYDCINEIQMALEGLLSPEIKEEITGTAEIRQVFKISKIGTVAGCYVTSGKINRNDRVRVLRDGFPVYNSTLSALKRFKDDVREVDNNYECGMSINGFNDIQVGDIVEAYKQVEVKRKLS
jgi:translation initiation factor IF-2